MILPFPRCPFAVAAALIMLPAIAEDGPAVGRLSELSAWHDKMPGSEPSLHLVGKITAPTPCHDAVTELAGEAEGTLRVAVTLVEKEGFCTENLADLEFRYDQPGYSGSATSVEISSASDTQTVPIETVF